MKARLAFAGGVFALVCTACDFTPKGSIVFHVPGEKEYDKAQLAYPPSEGERRQPLKLRFFDTNTWLTTATLAPGNYMFSARTGEGAFYSHEVHVTGNQTRYELPATSKAGSRITLGPKVSGTLSIPAGVTIPPEVVVIFIGHDVTVRRVPLHQNKFAIEAPQRGRYRVEVHLPGEKPLSFASRLLDINTDLDLEKIPLQ
ncbi:MAG: hypothetical protein ACR2IE_02910 [Candidatus Sumerlaeaceae bacterium]